jgi:hydroxypyruvate isomerase
VPKELDADRRRFLAAGAAGAAASYLAAPEAGLAATRSAAPYTLSINLELMFPATMARGERIRTVAKHGVKAFGFWQPANEEEERGMLKAQEETGLLCSIANGSGRSGQRTGFTYPGHEDEYFEQFTVGVQRAKRFGAPHANSFCGLRRPDLSWAEHRRLIIEGVKRAADIARKHDVTITLEALYNENPDQQQALSTATTVFEIVDALADPNVKVCFDVYHLQLNEGNLTSNLKLGLAKDWVRIVQSGDAPGRKEPGTGEINHAHLFRVLRQIGYAGYLDTEHGTTATAAQTIEQCKAMVAAA